MPLADLPYWPRYLSRDEAARYLGVSVDVFDDEVRAGDWPRGTPRGSRGGRLTWDRHVLDGVADSRAGFGTQRSATAPEGPNGWDRRFAEKAAARRQ
ncbi:MAG: DNA-binding protein [Acetobacteraceae bacterium]